MIGDKEVKPPSNIRSDDAKSIAKRLSIARGRIATATHKLSVALSIREEAIRSKNKMKLRDAENLSDSAEEDLSRALRDLSDVEKEVKLRRNK